MPRGSGGFFCAEPRAGTALQPALPAAQGLMSLHHICPYPNQPAAGHPLPFAERWMLRRSTMRLMRWPQA